MFEVFSERRFSTLSTISVDLRNFLEIIAAFASTNRIKDINEKFVDVPIFSNPEFRQETFFEGF